ncbi:hypothetical protein [Streptomyces sp. WAC 04229]|uniref:hypothetical protein n=1 Tax=Streptomyces sp. WAC 04229 TaxID=2203206 RepID=UPI003D735C6C
MTTASTGVTSFTAVACFTFRTAPHHAAPPGPAAGLAPTRPLGWPYRTPVHDTAELVVGELAANAVTHGRVPGRDAELRLAVTLRAVSWWR